MNLLADAAWTVSVVAVAAYALAARRPQRVRWFNAANVVAAAVLVPYDLLAGAPAAAVLSVAFGLIGLWGLVK